MTLEGRFLLAGVSAMPIHDWSRLDANLFHDFHQTWAVAIRSALNAGLLPNGYTALVEQHAPLVVPDVLALELGQDSDSSDEAGSGGAVPSRLSRSGFVLRLCPGAGRPETFETTPGGGRSLVSHPLAGRPPVCRRHPAPRLGLRFPSVAVWATYGTRSLRSGGS